MKKSLFTAAAALVAGVSASNANAATVINFDNLGSSTMDNVYGSITVGDFILTNDAGLFRVWQDGSPNDADPNSNGYSVITNSPNATVTLKRMDNALFDFNSIDLSEPFRAGAAPTNVFFGFTRDSGLTSQNVTLDGTFGLQTVNFNQLGVRSISFTGSFNSYAAFDNAVLNAQPAAPIPEPATWAMLLAGFAAVGGAMRSGKRKDATATPKAPSLA